ncbi:hypothetical protein CISECK367B_13265 [Citrobacter sedlakii]|uniref:hypothetical protein n=1 Tax=Citrobacter sedlakii TaxID=67826 RepID=UPI003B262F53
MSKLTEAAINSAMYSSLEGYALFVVDSLEFELGRKLNSDEHQQVFKSVEQKIGSMTDKQALLSTDKHANQHMLSRLIVEAKSAELRAVAEAVEQYTDRLIAALEAAEKRIAELEARTLTIKQFDEFQICHYGASEDYAKGYIDCQNNYNKALSAAGIGKGE